MGFLQRPDVDRHLVQLIEFTLQGDRLARKSPAQHVQVFIEMLPLRGARNTEAGKLMGNIARPHAQDQAALGQHIKHGVILRHDQGVVEG